MNTHAIVTTSGPSVWRLCTAYEHGLQRLNQLRKGSEPIIREQRLTHESDRCHDSARSYLALLALPARYRRRTDGIALSDSAEAVRSARAYPRPPKVLVALLIEVRDLVAVHEGGDSESVNRRV
jgi:citrate lyase beta subunit